MSSWPDGKICITRNINENLKWEQNTEWNVGLDYSLFDNRIYGSFDWYYRRVNDLLYSVGAPMPPMVYNTMMKNVGSLENKGCELEVGADIIRKDDLTLSSKLRLSHNSSRLLNMGLDKGSYIDEVTFPSPGNPGQGARLMNDVPIGQFFCFKYAGLTEEGNWLIYDKDNNVVEANDKTLVTANKHFTGNAIPKLILGWDNSLRYKHFDASISLRSWIDFDIFSQTNMYFGLKNKSQLDALKAYFYKKGLDYFGGMPLYDSSRDGAKGRSTDKETFAYVETLLKNAIANLKIKETLGASEDGYIKRAAAAAMLAQLYFNALSYGETDHFGECAQICQDIIDGKYGKYALDDTWYGPHCFTNDKSPEIIWSVPSENSKMEVNWYFKYFYHMNSYKYFNAETKGYNGFMLSPSLKPDGSLYTDKLGRPYSKFSDQDLRKKPYRYMGNEKYEGMFLVGEQVNPNDPSMKCTGQKEYKGKVLNLVDQVARFSEVGSGKKYASVDELPSTMADGEENSGIRLVKSPQPDMNDITKRYNPDWPIIRLAEIYYMLAECKLRSGDKATAAQLINKVRSRNFAGGNDPDPVTAQNLDMYRMLDEWMTEFLGEGDGRRRTDLIRWNLFTTATWWDHKADGDDTRNRFPIPNKAISANNLLKQNPGYE